MKQVINITLGGRNIAIEDDAYQKVKAYIESLRKYFENEEGRDEIVADIEARFAELVSHKIRKGAPHITDDDVNEMIATMGRPEDFAAQDSANAQGGYTPNFTFHEKRRLYRDESNKVLGGVCSGIANWLNIDPTIVRVLFAIVSLGGFGAGFIIYVALWMFLPARSMNVYKGKRMFRDSDNKWFGGVAGGMGAYFNINPNNIRWVLVISLLFGIFREVNMFGWGGHFNIFPNLVFSGITGTFVFIYIVLWIVLPEALTPYQKMEMRGKRVDVNSIKENVQSSMSDLGNRIQNWGKEVQESAERLGQRVNEFTSAKTQTEGRKYAYMPPKHNRGISYVFAMIFKVFFVMVGGIIVLLLLAVFLTLLFSGFAWAPINNFLWTSETQQLLGWGTLILFIGTPIVGLVIWLVRKILSVKTPGNYLNWTFGGLWAIGWVCLMFFLASVSGDFKRYEWVEVPVALPQPVGSTLVLKVSQPELEYEGNFGWIEEGHRRLKGFSFTNDTLKVAIINIDFEKSQDSLYHVMIVKQAMGGTNADALNRAKKISYNITQQDSTIDLPSGFLIDKNSKYRAQNVLVLVQVPVGKKINIDETVFDKLCHININKRGMKRYRQTSPIDRYRYNTDYIMQKDGSLKSSEDGVQIISSNEATNDDNYRWNDDLSSKDSSRGAVTVDSINATTEEVYHYNESPSKNKEALEKELKQKQKEIEVLKKQLQQ